MATLNLTKVWVNLLESGAGVAGNSDPDRSQQHEAEGEVRALAGGRLRSITREGVHGTFGVTLLQLSKTDLDTLKLWIGQAVQVRDHRGQLFFGVYRKVGVGEHRHTSLWKASIELELISHTVGV